ncbi:MAG: ribonuclease III [Sphingobacteriia bacterium]|nr:ribonuclease III [Sphingobacteriia bacterium]
MKSDIQKIHKWCNEVLKYQFKNDQLIIKALTHPSVTGDNKKIKNYERLEFLGDTVLSMVVSEVLITKFLNENEGDLARRRAALVCSESLYKVALKINLNEQILLSNGEESQGGKNKPNNLENCFEAVIGAIYLDGGVEVAKKFILECYDDMFDNMQSPPKDPKSKLQEWTQQNGKKIPLYIIKEKTGPGHSPIFLIQLEVEGIEPIVVSAGSRKAGERLAAEQMLKILNLL